MTEARNGHDEEFGVNRLVQAIGDPAASAGDLLSHTLDAVRRFGADAQQYDDITVVVARCESARR